MKRLTLVLAILLLSCVVGCQSNPATIQLGAARQPKEAKTPQLAYHGNWLLPLLAKPSEQLSAGEKKWVDFVRSCKVSSPQDAITRVLRFADDKPQYMADARLLLGVVAIDKAGRGIGNVVKAGDLFWVLEARMPGGVVQVFWVNAGTGDVIPLLEDEAPNKPDAGDS